MGKESGYSEGRKEGRGGKRKRKNTSGQRVKKSVDGDAGEEGKSGLGRMGRIRVEEWIEEYEWTSGRREEW